MCIEPVCFCPKLSLYQHFTVAVKTMI